MMRARKDLTYRVEEPAEGTVIYRLAGDLFGSAAGYAFQNVVRDGVAAGSRRVVLDLAEVTRIDSTGVGILVALMWSASRGGAALALAALPAHVEGVLSIAMLLPHISHAATVDDALAGMISDAS